jgi:tripartite-type tricarboxylate transporter receptor subunit TctC
MKQCRIVFGTFVASFLPLAANAGAQPPEQQYPTRTIRIILPTGPGGSVDHGARILAEKLRERLGQSVVVENRAGANTIIGTAAVAKAPPDGYTLLFVSSSHVLVPLVVSKLPYDPIRDFAPVGTMAYTPYVMVTHPSLPVNSVQQFIAYAKSKPGALNYGSSGVGLGSHIAAEVFSTMTGTRMQHVPYKSGGQVVSELAGGQVQVSWNSVGAVAPLVKAGKLRALAVSADSRVPMLPDVPTFSEAGVPQFQERVWLGLFAPAGTPKPIVNKLSDEMARILRSPDVRKTLEMQGLVPFISTPESFSQQVRTETASLAPVVNAANIKLEAN